MRFLLPLCMSVRLLHLTFEPLVDSSGIWQRGKGLEYNNIPVNGTEIDSWVMERNPVSIPIAEKESAFIC